ncbi:MAG: cobalt ECF transporter T component CbiQ [Oscillospiraceae bacterium]|nr:cobalt ECF transporter T component CbiQ [Oscillospiraceae bacterium]
MRNKVLELYALEQLSGADSCVHRLHPTAKLLATLVFIITVVSFDRYAFFRLVPYVFFPTLLTALSGTPYSMLIKRFLIALPFCVFAGITNVIFDRSTAFVVAGLSVSGGVVSLFAILFRAYLCVMAALLLVSVTPLASLTDSMQKLKVPYVFVAVFEMTYRYIGVLFEEAYSMYVAYSLRSAKKKGKGIEIADMGAFIGQLFLRSFDRAERIYNAMKCRGRALRPPAQGGKKPALKDVVFCAVTCFLCVALRIFDTNVFLGGF